MYVRKYELVSAGLLRLCKRGGARRLAIIACYAPGKGKNERIGYLFSDKNRATFGRMGSKGEKILPGDLNGGV